ncbi:MAG: single-stranded DNA-binding protein [Puniceicoccales bacterium]|jgi:single-strand DNA-binding protein|nr:single-stranded DNA-binding protein [Puniceicoccales bacterium]
MASFNKVILAGNLTRDPELRTLPSGMTVARLALAINRRFTSKDGEQREEVTYVDIDSFGKQAETIAKYCTKGSGLLVEGRLKLDQWEDKNSGEKRSRMGVVLETFTFLGGRSGDSQGGGGYEDSAPPPRRAPAASSRQPSPPPANDGIEEDVPF